MTIEQYFTNELEENGLWSDEAEAVIEKAKSDSLFESMQPSNYWKSDVSGFPSSALKVIWISLRSVAADWLKENKPQHFAIPIFADSEETI